MTVYDVIYLCMMYMLDIDSKRTTEEWLNWANANGYTDLAAAQEPGRLYCSLCCLSIVANRDSVLRRFHPLLERT